MSNITNIQRDGNWCDPHATEITWSSDIAVGANLQINADSTVYDAKAFATAAKTTISVATGWRGIGCYVKAPVADTVPYRVKGFYISSQLVCAIGVGYGPASPTGTDDVITPVRIIPIPAGHFDELIMVPALDSSHADYGKPLAICMALTYATGGYGHAHLSVQRLATTPPGIASSVP